MTGNPRQSCTSPIYAWPGYRSRWGPVACCVDGFAEGAISARDLCAPCSGWLTAALDRAAGYRLPWHGRELADSEPFDQAVDPAIRARRRRARAS